MHDVFKLARDEIARVGLAQILSSYAGIEVPTGKNIKCILPDHDDKTPSARVYETHYHCFSQSCSSAGKSLDAIDLLSAITGENKKSIAERIAGIDGNDRTQLHKKRKYKAPLGLAKPKYPVKQTKPKYPIALGLSNDALAALSHFWDLVKDESINEPCIKLLKDRGLDPAKAYELGVRSSALNLCSVLLKYHSKTALIEAGFINKQGHQFTYSSGLLIPSWADKDKHFPLLWRLRPLDQSKVKVRAMHCRSVHLLGLYSLSYGTPSPYITRSSDTRPSIVILTEGEPDYLTLVASRYNLGSIAIISILGRAYPSWLPYFLCKLNYSKVIDLTHQPKSKGESIAKQMMKQIVSLDIDPNNRPQFIELNQPEDDDLNDQLKKGELDQLISKLQPFTSNKHESKYSTTSWPVNSFDNDDCDISDDDLPDFLKNL